MMPLPRPGQPKPTNFKQTERVRKLTREALGDEIASLHGVRKALQANAEHEIEANRPTAAAQMLEEADGYTERINAVLDRYLDQGKAA